MDRRSKTIMVVQRQCLHVFACNADPVVEGIAQSHNNDETYRKMRKGLRDLLPTASPLCSICTANNVFGRPRVDASMEKGVRPVVVRREMYVSTEGVVLDVVYPGGRDGAVMIFSVIGARGGRRREDWMVGSSVDGADYIERVGWSSVSIGRRIWDI